MTDRLTFAEAADYLGLSLKSLRTYRYRDYAPGGRTPTFPDPDESGRFAPEELTAWNRGRRGKVGGPRIGERPAHMQCERPGCEARLQRRWKWVDPDSGEALRLCKPHWLELQERPELGASFAGTAAQMRKP